MYPMLETLLLPSLQTLFALDRRQAQNSVEKRFLIMRQSCQLGQQASVRTRYDQTGARRVVDEADLLVGKGVMRLEIDLKI